MAHDSHAFFLLGLLDVSGRMPTIFPSAMCTADRFTDVSLTLDVPVISGLSCWLIVAIADLPPNSPIKCKIQAD